MKKIAYLVVFVALSFSSRAQHAHTPLQTELDSVSYAISLSFASSLKQAGITKLNYTVFSEALEDVLEHNHAAMDAQAANLLVQTYVNKLKAGQLEAATAEGTAFLAANAKKEGVVTLPSGLQYKIIKQGTGAIPVDGQKVKTHYKGTLLNGDVFDSSYDRGQPLSFGVNGVIKGWTEALKLMPVGSMWELYIPQDLAYGDRAMGAKIPAYSTLIFTIELLEIEQ